MINSNAILSNAISNIASSLSQLVSKVAPNRSLRNTKLLRAEEMDEWLNGYSAVDVWLLEGQAKKRQDLLIRLNKVKDEEALTLLNCLAVEFAFEFCMKYNIVLQALTSESQKLFGSKMVAFFNCCATALNLYFENTTPITCSDKLVMWVLKKQQNAKYYNASKANRKAKELNNDLQLLTSISDISFPNSASNA